MAGPGIAGEVLGAMITPAVLISASGTLVLSTSNRLSRVVDRVRVLSAEAESWRGTAETEALKRRRLLVAAQVERLSERAVMLRTSLTTLYAAIGLLVATSIGVGLVALFEWRYSWLPVGLGLAGSCALLFGSLLLVREARLAIGSTLEELDYVKAVVASISSETASGT